MIGELLPASVVSEVAYQDVPQARLEPAEELAVARAVESRRREFGTVRHCARTALGRLGVAYRPLVPGRLGAPSWPDGVVGSMTHCAGYRAAAVARTGDLHSLGVDAEPDEPLPEGVLGTIALPSEREQVTALLATDRQVSWDRLLFSAKEAVYKAWFPLAGQFLDFSEAELSLAPDGTFRARLLVPGPTVDGRPLEGFTGRWATRDGLLATAIAVPRG
ncbi:4'-phosphopantetheinyl transferase family protein [Kitasatospora sp. NPDC004240]